MIRKSTNDLLIRPKVSKTARMATIVCGLFAFSIAVYYSYSYGVKSGHTKYDDDQALISQLDDTISKLRSDLSKAEEGLIFAQRQQQIQEEAYKQINQAYANSEQKNRVLGSRLDFYRSIISPQDGQSGPAIQSLDHKFSEGQLTFDVTLVQAIKHKHQVRGNLRVTLYENEVPTGQWPISSPRSVSYQYFEQISGSIEKVTLANNAKLKVELILQEGDKLERWFNIAQASKALGAE